MWYDVVYLSSLLCTLGHVFCVMLFLLFVTSCFFLELFYFLRACAFRNINAVIDFILKFDCVGGRV